MYSITLQTSDTIVVSGDRLGQVQFAASNESDGSAAIDVAGSVFCQAEGAFQSASNPTSIVLATAAADSSAAVGRIKVTDQGHMLPLANNAYDMGNSSFQYKNGYFSEGVVLSNNTPSVTTNKLYNDNGTLKFNGSSIGGGSPGGDVTGNPSGVAFFDDDGTITDDISGLVFNKTSNSLGINRIPEAQLDVLGISMMKASASTEVPLTVRSAAAPSANLTEWRNNDNDVLASVNQRGELTLNTAKVNSGRENIITAKISESDSSFGVTNLTSTNGLFLPAFYGYNNDDNRSALGFIGYMSDSNDNSTTNNGVIDFNVCKIPDDSSDPMNESRDPITSKNLLTIRNNATRVVTINRRGHLQTNVTATGVALSLQLNNNSATESPIFELRRTSSSPANNDKYR